MVQGFRKIVAELVTTGGYVEIEKAVAAGAEPLKLVEIEATASLEVHSVVVEQVKFRPS